MNDKNYQITRRKFIKTSGAVSAVGFAVPYIVSSSVFGADTPSERINIGCIGVGRMGLGDITDIHGFKDIQIVAVCDVDSKRAAYAKKFVEEKYAAQSQTGKYKGCTSYGDYRKLLERKDIDAVMICTPDHWHVLPAIAAAKAGKDIFLQKPLSLTIEEGRALSDAVKKYSTVFIIGSQQRSDRRFRFACELARNGRIGKLHTVKVGFGLDPGTTPQPPMPVPENLNYDIWLGPAPYAEYTEKRVHPQEGYGRPGWLRIRDYGWGMITGWGSHHMDIAHWGMGAEYTGPVEIKGWAEFPKDGLWDVHGDFSVEYKYANGVNLICAGNSRNKQGVLFEGSEGWVYVKRGFIDAQPKSLLTSQIGPDEVHLYKSDHHKGNFIQCIRSRSETVAPVEVAHRSCSACILGGISMLLPRALRWDPAAEKFINDPEADKMVSRPMRSPWSL